MSNDVKPCDFCGCFHDSRYSPCSGEPEILPMSKTSKRANGINDREPNFRVKGRLYLVRCFKCSPKIGRENLGTVVASGRCAFCGWKDKQDK